MRSQNSIRSWLNRLLYTTRAVDDDRNRARRVINSLILHVHPPRVSKAAIRFAYTWGLGGISATLVLLQALTGVLLMFRYEPSVERAYASIQALETQVVFGSLIRGIHHWSANLLVISIFLHLFRVFFTGGFKKGRITNWMIGVGLLVLVLLFNFTGYLLPWDQLAYWGITVVTSLISYIPLIGQQISRAVLAGNEVGQGALSNFYALHVAGLPGITLVLLSYHFWRVRKDGGISQPELPKGERVEKVTTIPNLVRKEFAVAVAAITVVTLWSMFTPAPLGEMANPMRSPNPAKAAWYLGGFQELLLHMDTLAAMTLVFLMLIAVTFLPKLDRQEDNIGIYFRSSLGRRAALVGAVLALDLVPLGIIADEYWIDWLRLFPNWPSWLATGLVPLLVIVLGLVVVYATIRFVLKASHSETLVGAFAFVMMSFIVLTVTNVFFRGPNMALVLPF